MLEDAWTDDDADPGDAIISEGEPGRAEWRQCLCQAGVGVKDDQHHIPGGSQDQEALCLPDSTICLR